MPAARARPGGASRTAVALALTGALALTSCGGDGDAPDKKRKAGEPVTRSPLTGRVVEGKVPGHPVLAVKIDNSANSAPQVGLGRAGLVVEELVEGGITRLAVFYYTDVPKVVGPVRSMRATDIGVVKPLDAVLVASGGAAPTVTRVKDAEIRTFTEGAPGYYREGGRVAPYNLFMRLRELARTLTDADPPQPYLPFAASPSMPKGEPVNAFTATFSPSSSSSFTFRDGRYLNTDTLAAEGDQFVADTVLVLKVSVGDAGYLDPAGNPVPETIFEGKGEAMIFSDGRLVRGTWSKAGLEAKLRLRADGKRVTLPRGKVFIELVPASGGSVTVGP